MTGPAYHGWTHATDADGNAIDPIPGLTTGGTGSGQEWVEIIVNEPTVGANNGDNQAQFWVPAPLNGYTLTGVYGFCTTAPSTNATIQIRDTNTGDMLTTAITIEAGETDSTTASTAPVIDTGNDSITTGQTIMVDIDANGNAYGIGVVLVMDPP